ncbi:hypothetical protein Sfulv_34500 [Streptomyces fulvorobeus]|uniref:Uncharacterized protein n=1 Tax=Streptomyces fulvorobeus TaxID=284028 RepID=A0A7J0C846_9ACTN|nr:hypothetical protein [Streptomyces fulvorobeus]GFM98639.1 hypothetical protein Sfulv_34500 [Streptomyces fulvorobeus]
MSVPVKAQERPARALPEPELVSLIDDPHGPYADSPAGWWDQYGGALDMRSGVVCLPGPVHPPSPFHPDECPHCVQLQENP